MPGLRQTYICAIYNTERNEADITITTDPIRDLASLQSRCVEELRLLMLFEGNEEKLGQIKEELAEERVDTGKAWNIYHYNQRVLTVLLGCHRQAVRNIAKLPLLVSSDIHPLYPIQRGDAWE